MLKNKSDIPFSGFPQLADRARRIFVSDKLIRHRYWIQHRRILLLGICLLIKKNFRKHVWMQKNFEFER